MKISNELQRQFNKAKIGLMRERNSVFITTILFSLKQVWVEPDHEIKTAGVDGVSLFINTEWFGNLTHKAKIGLLAHESWHVAFNHLFRANMMGANAKKYNRAADYVINIMLQDAGYELPPNGLVDSKYRDMSTEQVYALLKDEPEDEAQDGEGNPYEGDMQGAPGGMTNEEGRAKVQDIIIKASTQSQMSGDAAGTIPGHIAIALDKLLNPKLDWRTILANYMDSFAKEDYSFRRPNRRFMPEYYLPSLFSEGMSDLAVAVDTSGSVSDEQFNAFRTEIHDMMENLKPQVTTIVDFDTEIRNVHTLQLGNSVEDVDFTGRGGTDLTPVFKHFKESHPKVLLVFSDLCCSKIQEDPGYPVIWIIIDNKSAEVNFGKMIHYET